MNKYIQLAHLYTKPRKDFGKHCKFSAVPAIILESIPITDIYKDQYVMRNPSISCFDTAPHMSEHDANTERLVTKNSSMRHLEGGWPKDVDFTEQSDVSRFRKKAEKDDDYKGAVKALGPIIARCLKQNNTIDIYEVQTNLLLKVLTFSPRIISRAIMLIIPVNRQVRKAWRFFVIPMKSSAQRHPSTGTLIPQLLLKLQFLIPS